MSGFLPYAVYVLTKVLAYTAWCFLGIAWFASSRRHRLRSAFLFGLGRFLLGVFLGLGIFLAALSMNNATRNAPLTYFAIYVPVRLGEWLLWYFVLRTRSGDARAALWVGGGIVISCLSDIPLGILEGGVIPVGRPFC
jgi:hypothetical protein